MQEISQIISSNSFIGAEVSLEPLVERIDPYRRELQEDADTFPTECRAAVSCSLLRQIKSSAAGGRPSVHE